MALALPTEELAPAPDDPGWEYAQGQPITSDLRAWEMLGDGDRFETWLAWSTTHWAPVTVKLPRPSCLGSERALASLRREAQFVRQVQHPSFQRLLEDRLDTALPLLVYEYVEGPSLSTVLDDAPLSPIDTVLVGLQLASALHYLHHKGVVHLDLKPANVLLRDGRVVLIDLGLAKPNGTPNPPGRARGTRDYMAPEQCRRQPADPRMDLFALGALLYEASVGERAFSSADNETENDTDGDTDDEPRGYPQLQHAPVPAPQLVPDYPPDLWSVVTWLLRPEPTERAQTAADVLVALQQLIPEGDEGLWPDWVDALLRGAPPASPPSPDRTSSPKPRNVQ